MKTYEKPRLMALSLSGNDQLCGSCTDQGGTPLYKDPTGFIAQNIDDAAGDGDGILTRAEVENLFSSEDGCKDTRCEIYCKFTSSGGLVAWS